MYLYEGRKVVVSAGLGSITTEVGRLQRVTNFARTRVTTGARVARRRCERLRGNRASFNFGFVCGYTRIFNMRVGSLLTNDDPGLSLCAMAHGNRNLPVTEGANFFCASLTPSFNSGVTRPFCMGVPSKVSGVHFSGRRNRRLSVIVDNGLLFRVRGRARVLGPNSAVCCGDKIPRKVGTLSNGSYRLCTVILEPVRTKNGGAITFTRAPSCIPAFTTQRAITSEFVGTGASRGKILRSVDFGRRSRFGFTFSYISTVTLSLVRVSRPAVRGPV